MRVRVYHKGGSQWPNFKAAWRVWWKLLFKKEAMVTVTFDQAIANAETGTMNWLKVCGWKSGAVTKTNNETLIAYRIVGPCVEFCRYERRGERLFFDDIRARGIGRLTSITYEIERPKGSAMRWPAISWSEGGGKIPLASFGYFLEIE